MAAANNPSKFQVVATMADDGAYNEATQLQKELAQEAMSDEHAADTIEESRSHPMLTRTQGGRLSTKMMNFGIPTNQATHDHAYEEHGKDSWRFKTLQFIHSSKVQILLMALLFCDVIILFIELLFVAQYPHCSVIERDAISCCPASNATIESEATHVRRWMRFLEKSKEGEHDYCDLGHEALSYPATCDPHKWSGVHTAEDVLFAFTTAILSIFMIELTAAMVALTPQVFFRQFFFLLDFVIISVSLALEVFFHAMGDEIYQYVAGLLVIARIWRFVRIGHGIVELTNEMAHREYSDLLAYTEELQFRLKENNIPLPNLADYVKKEQKESILSELERNHREERRERIAANATNGGNDDDLKEPKA